jgi:hypothetical protein
MLPTDAKARKALPITTGVLDYFPDALAAVAEVSVIGNNQHNPGQPLHWAKEKSTDHADCIIRHLMERGTRDADGARHSAKLAWRALALLQIEIEREAGIKWQPIGPSGDTGQKMPESPLEASDLELNHLV